MPPRPSAASRRVVLGAALLGAAGCSFDSLDPTSEDPTVDPSGSVSPGAEADAGAPTDAGSTAPDDDAELVTGALAALARAHRTAAVNARLHPGLAGVLRPLERLHLTHARELGDLPRASGRVGDPGEADAAVLARVARQETALQQVLVSAAVAAASGPLAQTLAAMAAATAQQRVALDGRAA